MFKWIICIAVASVIAREWFNITWGIYVFGYSALWCIRLSTTISSVHETTRLWYVMPVMYTVALWYAILSFNTISSDLFDDLRGKHIYTITLIARLLPLITSLLNTALTMACCRAASNGQQINVIHTTMDLITIGISLASQWFLCVHVPPEWLEETQWVVIGDSPFHHHGDGGTRSFAVLFWTIALADTHVYVSETDIQAIHVYGVMHDATIRALAQTTWMWTAPMDFMWLIVCYICVQRGCRPTIVPRTSKLI